jgi:lysophospholipase L1-like esterase
MNHKITKLFMSTIAILLIMVTSLTFFISSQSAQAATPIKVMPLGDSITDGFTTAGGYRIQFYNRLVADGLTGSLDFVGSQSNGPASLLDREHEGHTGWHVADLAANIDTWMTNASPKIVMLMIGTNDILHSQFTGASTRLSSLIDQICAKLPAGGKLYVSTIPTLGSTTYGAYIPLVDQYNADIPGIVQSKVAAGKPVFLVDMHSVITASDLTDEIHPTAAGYDKMGNAWYAIIKNDLTGAPVSTPTRTNTPGITNTPTNTVGASPTRTPTFIIDVITPTLTRTPTQGTGPTNTATRTPTAGFTATRTSTPTTGPSFTPTLTTGGVCSPVTSTVTAPFTWDGAGVYCWQIATIPGYMNNWNNNAVSINGTNYTNLYVASGSLPAKINNNYYISFNGSYAWSHLEIR